MGILPTVSSEGSHLLQAANTRAPQTPVQRVHPVQLERAVADAVENDSYMALGHLQSQMSFVAAKIHHQLDWLVTPVGQMQDLGSMTAMGIDLVGGWGSYTVRAGRLVIDV